MVSHFLGLKVAARQMFDMGNYLCRASLRVFKADTLMVYTGVSTCFLFEFHKF